MGDEWLKDLEKFETNWNKPFLEDAPWLIIVFKKVHDLIDGEKRKNYYLEVLLGSGGQTIIDLLRKCHFGFSVVALELETLTSASHSPRLESMPC